MGLHLSKNNKLKAKFNHSILKSFKIKKTSKIGLSCILGLVASQSIQTSVRSIVINDTAGSDTAIEIGSPFTAITDILFFDEDQDGFVSECTGSLIAEKYILTAQHCFNPFEFGEIFPEDVSVRFSDEKNDTLTNIAVSDISFLDDTFSDLDGTDIAVLELEVAAPEDIKPLKLFGSDPQHLITTDPNDPAIMVGFGEIGVGDEGSNFNEDSMRWGAENFIGLVGSVFDPVFDAIFESNIINTDYDDGTEENNSIGSKDPLDNEGTTAAGDSGGPLLVRNPENDEYLIAGVVTGGSSDFSTFGDVSWWTGVTEHREFIESFGAEFVGDFVPVVLEPTDDIQNSSFEKGLTGWSRRGSAGVTNSTFPVSTSQGDSQALIVNDEFLGIASTNEIEELLELDPGDLDAVSGSLIVAGSAIKQTFQAKAGDVLTFDFNFLTDEWTPDDFLNDFSFVSLASDVFNNPFIDLLADTFSDFVDSDTAFFSETGYQSYSYVIPETGTYTLGFGVADAEEIGGLSGLLVDNVKLASTPEPTTTIGLFGTVFATFSLLKRKRK
ncbi:MAG: trypsin-like serine protease [Okeania sp. SIO2H7]|nr:trypsin-like serine protease [Okeania sp. SIO2H7]